MASLSFVSSVASGRCAIAIAVAGLFAAAGTSRAETTIEPGVDRSGADLSSFDLPQAVAERCRQACEQDAGLAAMQSVRRYRQAVRYVVQKYKAGLNASACKSRMEIRS
jgi:hypothetical protein